MHRRVQRLTLFPPLAASLDGERAIVLDLSILGAGVEHLTPLKPRSRVVLRLEGDPAVEVRCVVNRCGVDRFRGEGGADPVYRSGLVFFEPSPPVRRAIASILVGRLTEMIAEWKANARGADGNIGRLSAMRRGMSYERLAENQAEGRGGGHYLWFRLTPAGWRRTTTSDPNQPLDGFAVSQAEEESEIALLREAYERSTDEGRHFIRLVAHLAIARET